MKSLARKNIALIKPYIAGKPIEETKRELGLKKVIKLASNENPLGPSPKAVKAIKQSLKYINRYPDSSSFYLKAKLAQYYGLKPVNILVGNGSDELIEVAIKTFVEKDENIVTADVTFLEYAVMASVNDREIRTAPLNNFKYDLNALYKKVNNNTKLIFIANPNNPTGTYVNSKELGKFIKDLPKSVIIVLDEAYDVFVDIKDFPNTLKLINSENVIVLKTFSKGFGLAGLRIGAGLANQDFCACMEKVRQPFNVNLLAQVGALAAIDDKEFLLKTQRCAWEGKLYLYEALNNLNLKFIPTVANFILVDVGRDCLGVFKDMLKYGVIVRDMKQYNLDNFIRITIGTRIENELLVSVLKKVL